MVSRGASPSFLSQIQCPSCPSHSPALGNSLEAAESSDGSRISSRFSSTSSDTTDTSFTSLSRSSTSHHPSPQLRGCSVVSCHRSATAFPLHSASSISIPALATGLAAGCSCSTLAHQIGLSISSSSPSSTRSAWVGSSGHHKPVLRSTSMIAGEVATGLGVEGRAVESSSTRSDLCPPENFAFVAPGVYRSSFPKEKNFTFLKSLGLKSVLTLVQEEYPADNRAFLQLNGIQFFQFSIPGNKEPFVHIPEDKIRLALAHLLDRRNHPILIHCNKGKHRTGCLVGCLRKMQHWSSTSIFDEYRKYSYPKSRNMDQQFIELFDQSAVWGELDTEHAPPWLDLTL